jgi:hypothetical protein
VGVTCDDLTGTGRSRTHPLCGLVKFVDSEVGWVEFTISSISVAKKVPLLAFLPPWSRGKDPDHYMNEMNFITRFCEHNFILVRFTELPSLSISTRIVSTYERA